MRRGTLVSSSTTYNYDDNNHKHAVTAVDTSDTYTYDANGNTLAPGASAGVICRVENGTTYKQEYNIENLLSAVKKMNGTCASATVVVGFDVASQDSNIWVMNVDATILVSVQNGYASSLNDYSGAPLTTGTGSLWRTFFDHLALGRTSENDLIHDWDVAEMAATNYAGSDERWSAPTQGDDKVFLWFGDRYRDAGNWRHCDWVTCVGGFFDPRSTFAQVFGPFGPPYSTYNNMSPVAALLGPVYVFDSMGISK